MTLSPEVQQMLAEQEARSRATEAEIQRASLEDFLDMYRSAVSAGGVSGFFLAEAFVSWYSWSRDATSCWLGAWPKLDARNRALFLRMLTLRDGDWEETPLWALDKYCRAELKRS